jgi:LuxR family maltose regulon positive regulatory protein
LAAWATGDLIETVDTFAETMRSLHQAGAIADQLGATVVLAGMWPVRPPVHHAALKALRV